MMIILFHCVSWPLRCEAEVMKNDTVNVLVGYIAQSITETFASKYILVSHRKYSNLWMMVRLTSIILMYVHCKEVTIGIGTDQNMIGRSFLIWSAITFTSKFPIILWSDRRSHFGWSFDHQITISRSLFPIKYVHFPKKGTIRKEFVSIFLKF